MLYYDRIDLSEGIDQNKSNDSKEQIICHYWQFDHRLKFQISVSNGCHDLMLLCLNLSNIAIITVKEVDYCCITYDTGKYDSSHILENSILNDCEYIQNPFE